MKVLIVEDDPAVRQSLQRSLAFEGYTVATAADGPAALSAVAEEHPDAVILDLGLPKLDGLSVCRRLRESGNPVPILVLTAREATSDRVTGLDAGADDYLPKPFALEELLARLRALLRRTNGPPAADPVLAVDDLRLDPLTREVTRAERQLSLTRTEYELLHLLLRHPRQVLTRMQILQEVWGYDFDPGSNTLEVYIGYLRRKTEDGGAPRLLHTVRGVGYVLKPASRPRDDQRDAQGDQ